jgi:hypothetical protein
VTSAFTRSAAEQAGDNGSGSGSGSGSRGSASHHTRTEEFMDILRSEFKTQVCAL